MAWSKVKKPFKKPFKWWVYKVMCELGYATGNIKMYYTNLNKLCKEGFNLYGEDCHD